MSVSKFLLAAAMLLLVAPTRLTSARDDSVSPTIEQKCELCKRRWTKRFETAKFEALVAPPFVIAGDGGAERLARYRDGTILAAARALRATYFTTPPDEPIVILLFESDATYRARAKEWFGDTDVPHFGYFRRDNVMLMNVATGTGTLVHELTHALVRPDFPRAPDWFNEGLASLYEQCSLNGDSIRGHVNWRLPALKKAIRDHTLRPLRELVEDPDFYGENLVGLNYAQARYVMLYLQEKELLAPYYRACRDGCADDPTGRKALEALLAPRQTLEEFEKDWRAWVVDLR